ncbi:MAG: hypothetical protein ACREL5_12655, partial [Gemmatimonadales bacterium]
MDDDQLDRLFRDAAEQWRVPVDPPLDAIWSGVEAEAFRRRRPGAAWPLAGGIAAAALLIGVAGGRYWWRRATMPQNTIVTTAPAPVMPAAAGADDHAMGELLGRTAVLLAALPTNGASTSLDPEITREGARLLTTTRLLLDAPTGSDPQLHDLLEDLELVLAQV